MADNTKKKIFYLRDKQINIIEQIAKRLDASDSAALRYIINMFKENEKC